MPDAPLKVCRWPGCHELTRDRSGYCEAHKGRAEERRKQQVRQWSRDRGNTSARGYDAEWRKVRADFLREHPLCADCLARGIVRAATVVHHLCAIAERPELRLESRNLLALCRDCHELRHGRKALREASRKPRRAGTPGGI